MSHTQLLFSDLLSAEYDTNTQVLEIIFKNGDKRQYRNVPSTVYFSLLNAYSPDRYFEKYICEIFSSSVVAQ